MLCLFTFTTYRFNLLPVRLALLIFVYGNVKLLVVVQVHVSREIALKGPPGTLEKYSFPLILKSAVFTGAILS